MSRETLAAVALRNVLSEGDAAIVTQKHRKPARALVNAWLDELAKHTSHRGRLLPCSECEDALVTAIAYAIGVVEIEVMCLPRRRG